MAESKLRENLRYLGYTAGIFGVMIIAGLVILFLEPIIAFLLGIIYLLIFLGFLLGIVAAAAYILFFRDKE